MTKSLPEYSDRLSPLIVNSGSYATGYLWLLGLDTRRKLSGLFLVAETPFFGTYCDRSQTYRLGSKPKKVRKHGRLTKRDLLRLELRDTRKNAVLQALRYQTCLDSAPSRTRAEVAVMFGVSRARVTQYLNLLKLPSAITGYLAESNDANIISYFTERRLRQLTSLQDDGQAVQRFREMLQEAARGQAITC